MDIKEFLEYLKQAKSKATNKAYKRGLKKFSEWYGKDLNTILAERFEDLKSEDMNTRKRFNREIEKFHRHLKRVGHTQNSANAYTEGLRALFRFYDMDVKNLPTEVTRKVRTIKDYVPTVQQYRDMFNCGNILDRTIISMALDVGWRIGDFVSLRIDQLPSFDQETPIPFDLITEKEEVVSKSFLSAQTVELLKSYLRTLNEDNPYLFQNGDGSHYEPEAINKRLKVLAKKAKIHIPRGKRLRFHCFRKRFLSECANAGLPVTSAKILVGKSVSVDMLTYLSEVEHKKAFEAVHERLRLTEVQATVTAKDKEIEALKKEVEELKILNRGLLNVLSTKQGRVELDRIETPHAFAELIVKRGTEAIRKEREEYRKLIEENNNNNNH
jgi:integrase